MTSGRNHTVEIAEFSQQTQDLEVHQYSECISGPRVLNAFLLLIFWGFLANHITVAYIKKNVYIYFYTFLYT